MCIIIKSNLNINWNLGLPSFEKFTFKTEKESKRERNIVNIHEQASIQNICLGFSLSIAIVYCVHAALPFVIPYVIPIINYQWTLFQPVELLT